MILKDLFEYTRPDIPEIENFIAVSPSQLYKFFEYPPVWYKECYLGETPEFKGNTATVLGTVCHYVYEHVANGTQNFTYDDLIETLEDKYKDNPDVDIEAIKKDIKPVTSEVVNSYILPRQGTVVKCEVPVFAKFSDTLGIAGTCDRIENNSILVDYKTVSSKPYSMPFHYRLQLMAYAYALCRVGYNIDTIRLVYGIRPTKTLPARIFTIEEHIDQDSIKFIEDALTLVDDTIKYVRKHPEYTYLLFKSMSLKETENVG